MPHDDKRRLSEESLRVLSGTRRGELTPPFQKVATDVIWVGFRIDHAAVRPFVPAGLKLTADSVGIIGIYQAPAGTGLAPYTRGLVAVSVQGEDDPGVDGLFVLCNVMDEPAAGLVRHFYCKATHVGTARTWREGALLRGVASVDGKDWLRATIRPQGRVKTGLSGVDVFIGETERGLVRHADSYVADVDEAEVITLEITDAAPPAMRALQPIEPLFALQALVNSSWGEPKLIGRGSASEALSTHLTLIENAGRAAMLVRADGMLVEANAGARALLGADARAGQLLFACQPLQRRTLCEAIKNSRTASRPRLYEPIVLALREGVTVVVHVLPVEQDAVGDEVAVVLLTDPRAQEGRDPVPTLQAFGLTAAEAKLAALVGGGLGVRGAADSLQISEHTARSTLKSVYEKLQIRKQSELGAIVARLQFP
jgi:DNA-binding CsgD family transcriptional regulator